MRRSAHFDVKECDAGARFSAALLIEIAVAPGEKAIVINPREKTSDNHGISSTGGVLAGSLYNALA
jgi:hypothetical protein